MALTCLPTWSLSQDLSDQELDHVTAAGQPAIITATNGEGVKFAPATDIEMTLGPSSQAGIRALVLNNVTGENQVANAINISSGPSAPDKQQNRVNQSWGSVSDTGVVGEGKNAQRLSTTADEIITASGTPFILFIPATAVSMTLESNAQTGLMALVVNNVAGLNQVAVASNVRSGATGLTDAGLLIGAGAASSSWQSNATNQVRGTPAIR
jgi:hypothetical protein